MGGSFHNITFLLFFFLALHHDRPSGHLSRSHCENIPKIAFSPISRILISAGGSVESVVFTPIFKFGGNK